MIDKRQFLLRCQNDAVARLQAQCEQGTRRLLDAGHQLGISHLKIALDKSDLVGGFNGMPGNFTQQYAVGGVKHL